MTTIEEAWIEATEYMYMEGGYDDLIRAARNLALAVLDEATRPHHADGCPGCQWMGDSPGTLKRGEECGHAALRARILALGRIRR